jgi:enoyl-CoA hydratase
MTELVHLNVDSGIATITLDSPANRNALSAQLMNEFSTHLESASGNAAVRSVVLAHTSSAFCSGADLSGGSGPERDMAQLAAILRQMLECPKPILSRIEGHVRGGGLGIVAACDLAVASLESSFAFSEVRLGVAPAVISLTVLPKLSSRATSKYFLTGDRFDAREAERIGLITAASENPELVLEQLATSFRSCSPVGLAETKKLTTRSILQGFAAQETSVTDLSVRLFSAEEAQEGIAAFKEGRPPRWAE